MRWIWLLIAAFIPGCAAPVLFIPTAINKPREVRVFVAPVKDNTKTYDEGIGLDKLIEGQIVDRFKGVIISGDMEAQVRYHNIQNPYRLVATADSADVIIKTTVEQLYYGPQNQSVMAGFLAFGIVGAAIADNNNSKVLGLIGVRTVITKPDGNVLMLKVHSGKSDKEKPLKLNSELALKQAAQDLSEQVLIMASRNNRSFDANKYYRIRADMERAQAK
jgi:hypothetical protein